MNIIKNKITERMKLHSIHIIILLFLAIFGGSVAIGFFVQTNPFIKSFDNYLYVLIGRGPHPEWLDLLIRPFNFNFLPSELSPLNMPSYFYPMVLGTLIYLFFKSRSLFLWAVFCFTFGTILSFIVTAVDWYYVFRERPFLTLPNQVDDFGKMAWEKLSSYPSGHARETALYSTIMAAFIPFLKWPAIIFTLFIVYSRVYVGAHYPTDAIAGALIGFLTAKTILVISGELEIILDKRKGGKHNDKPKKD